MKLYKTVQLATRKFRRFSIYTLWTVENENQVTRFQMQQKIFQIQKYLGQLKFLNVDKRGLTNCNITIKVWK